MDASLQSIVRTGAWLYWVLVIGLVIAEWIAPRRRATASLSVRWANNVALGLFGSYLLRWALPIAGVGWALVCQDRGWGLLNRWPAPVWLGLPLSVLAFDLTHYLQHRSFHANQWLWRVHRPHHSDQDFDFTTALRFHPFEVVITALVLFAVTALLGASPLAVAVSKLLGMVSTFVEHSNLNVPARLDRFLRALLVTPDMHGIHHSQAPGDSRTNLSTTFSFWDRLFGTYRAEPSVGYDHMVFGVADFADPKHLKLHWMLAEPFLTPSSGVVATRPKPSSGAIFGKL